MEQILERTLLYDFYGDLLTDHQKEIYEAVVFGDYSLTEVAEAHRISRQGVHDMIRRCDRALRGYEEKLGLVGKFVETRGLVRKIHALTEEFERTGNADCVREIEKISRQMGDL